MSFSMSSRPVAVSKLMCGIMLLAFSGICHGQDKNDKIDGDRLFDSDRVMTVEIETSDADWKTLREQTRKMETLFGGGAIEKVFEYVKADVSINGTKIESVGIRKKGLFGSLDNNRPSLKIKFDEYKKQKPVKGLTRLTLNNNKQDTSLISQYLTYKLFRDAGLHAPRSGFAKVTVNGKYLGIYTHVESVKKPFLQHSFGDDSGNLYEGTLTDFYHRTIDKLEAKTNSKESDRTDVASLSEALVGEGDVKLDEIEKLVDLDNFMRFWAMEGMLRMWDGYASNQNNFFFYTDPSNKLGYFLPWGTDSSFSKDGGPFARFGQQGPTSIYAQSVLTNRLYNTKGIPERYKKSVEALLESVWKEKELVAEIDRLEKLLVPHVGESQSDAARQMDNVRDFIESRREVISKELADWPAEVSPYPRKPQYTVPVGEVKGSFATTWMSQAPREPAGLGETQMEVNLDGKPLKFKELGAGAWLNRARRRFGPPTPGGERQSVSLTFTGLPNPKGNLVSISISIDREAFEQAESDTALKVTGRLTQGSGFGFGRMGRGGPMRSVNGTLTLSKTGTEDDKPVVGKVDLQIVEVRGGFFDRQRGPVKGRPTTN